VSFLKPSDPELAHIGHAQQRSTGDLTDGHRGILRALSEGEHVAIADIAGEVTKAEGDVHDQLDELHKQGLVQVVRDDAGRIVSAVAGPHLTERDPAKWTLEQIHDRERAGYLKTILILAPAVVLAQVASILYANWLGQSAFGYFSLIAGTAMALAYVPHLGMATSLGRFQTVYEQNNDYAKVRGLIIASSVVTIGVSLVIAILALGLAFLDRDSGDDFRAVALGGVFAGILGMSQLWGSFLVNLARPAWSAFPGQLVAPLLSMAVAGVIVAGANSLTTGDLLLVLVATTLLALFIQWFGMRGGLPKNFRTSVGVDMADWKTWVKSGPPVLLMSALVILLYRADLYALAILKGSDTVASYSAAITVAEILGNLPSAAYAGAVPFFAPFFVVGRVDLVQFVVRNYFRLILIPALLLVAGILIASGPVLQLYGEGFADARVPLAILLMAQLVSLAFGPSGYLLIMTGRGKDVTVIYGAQIFLDVALLVLLVPEFDMIGAAFATLISMIVAQVGMWWWVKHKLQVDSAFWTYFTKRPAVPATTGDSS
jgi:O-antigen/teichoic acid export membrane protein